MFRLFLPLALLVLTSACTADQPPAEEAALQDQTATLQRSPSSEDAHIFIANIEDGATVSSPFMVEFGLEGMDVVPAGTDQEYSGHHHLLIDLADLPPLDIPMPADSQHVHFGKGQTSVELELAPGQHTLQLILGNHVHIPHDPPVVSEKITVTVQ